MENDLVALDVDERFRFACSPEVPCFNECCRDLNQVLTPYDILRLKTRLGMRSDAFLSAHTEAFVGPETGLPVVRLRMPPEADWACPFVTDAGCSVYEDRPASCRTYPLARAIRRDRDTGAVTEHFALIREPHCRGFEQDRSQSVREWIRDQEVEVYNRFNDLLMDIIRLKNRHHPGPLSLAGQQAFRMGLYDSDGFREHLARSGPPEGMGVGAARLQAVLDDDLERLRFGHDWVRFVLFGVRDGAGA